MTVMTNKHLEFLELSSSGFPEGKRIPDGSTLHFVDTGDRYISFREVWERDMRYLTPEEMTA